MPCASTGPVGVGFWGETTSLISDSGSEFLRKNTRVPPHIRIFEFRTRHTVTRPYACAFPSFCASRRSIVSDLFIPPASCNLCQDRRGKPPRRPSPAVHAFRCTRTSFPLSPRRHNFSWLLTLRRVTSPDRMGILRNEFSSPRHRPRQISSSQFFLIFCLSWLDLQIWFRDRWQS